MPGRNALAEKKNEDLGFLWVLEAVGWWALWRQGILHLLGWMGPPTSCVLLLTWGFPSSCNSQQSPNNVISQSCSMWTDVSPFDFAIGLQHEKIMFWDRELLKAAPKLNCSAHYQTGVIIQSTVNLIPIFIYSEAQKYRFIYNWVIILILILFCYLS
jgi:hypothetical protein